MINFNEYQEACKETAIYLNKVKEKYPELPEEIVKILGVSYVGLGLGESSEVQGKIKKIIRDAGGIITDEVKENIKKELGDCLWYVAGICTELGISMNEVAESNITKLLDRKKRDVLGGSGDNR